MAVYATAELRNMVLVEIGVLPQGETPLAEDARLAETALDAVHARLEGEGRLNWPPCAVPSKVALSVVRLAARELVSAYGLSDAMVARIEAGAARAMREIYEQTTVGWTEADTVVAPYY